MFYSNVVQTTRTHFLTVNSWPRRMYLNWGELMHRLFSDSFNDAMIFQRAGTGLLGIVFASLVRQYTVTDIQELIPLITKNLTLNNVVSSSSSPPSKVNVRRVNVSAEALDWVALHNTPPNKRRDTYSYQQIDLLLVIDCIYHPSLLPSLIDTIDHLSPPEV